MEAWNSRGESDDWLSPFAAPLGVADAARRLGVTPSALQRALAVSTFDADGLRARGSCAGRRFSARRARTGRGVPWLFSFADEYDETRDRIAGLRSQFDLAQAAAGKSRARRGIFAKLMPWRGRSGDA